MVNLAFMVMVRDGKGMGMAIITKSMPTSAPCTTKVLAAGCLTLGGTDAIRCPPEVTVLSSVDI